MEEVRNYRKSESGNLVASKDLSTGDIVLSLQPLAAGKADSQISKVFVGLRINELNLLFKICLDRSWFF